MSIQSTRNITREAAERQYVALRQEAMVRKLLSEAVAMDDGELESAIETEFENFAITDEPEPEL